MVAVLFAVVGCGGNKTVNQELESSVDIDRFMGRWYVLGFTPTMLDKTAVNATETYAMKENGKIQTTYSFRKKTPNGKSKTYEPVGWVYDKESNSEWRMRFFGVYVAPYYILHVSEDYQHTVVGHPNRKLAWVMSRSPVVSDATYEELVGELRSREYDLSTFKGMVQEW